MNKHSLKVLEFEKILKKLSEFARLDETKEIIKKLKILESDELKKEFRYISEIDSHSLTHGYPPLRDLPEVKRILKTIQPENSFINPQEIFTCAQWLILSDEVKKHFVVSEFEGKFSLLIDKIKIFNKITGRIISSINGKGEILDKASTDLKRIRTQITSAEKKINTLLNRILNSSSNSSIFQDRIITVREDRFVLPVRAGSKGKLKGIIHDRSSSGETLYIEPQDAVPLNNNLKSLFLDEDDEIRKILKDISSSIREILPEFLLNIKIIVKTDLLSAKLRYAKSIKGTAPVFSDIISIKNARHPLLEKPVPININLGNDFTALVITGPNTGGKTVALKTAGLLSIMAKHGLYVPTDKNSLFINFNDIFCDIGDEQSIEQSLSTFSGHIKNIIRILKKAGKNSLVLLDELGAGTDPDEGSALGIAILEEFMSKETYLIASTHYRAIKNFVYSSKGIENASVEFDLKTLQPTFHLLTGVAGSSNAITISRSLGLPHYIADNAAAKISKDKKISEEMFREIEKDMKTAREKNKLASAQVKIKESLKLDYEKKIESLEKEKSNILKDTKTKFNSLYMQAMDKIQKIIKDLKKSGEISARTESEIKSRLKAEHTQSIQRIQNDIKINPEKKQEPIFNFTNSPITKGDYVKILSLEKQGYVTDIMKNNNIRVAIGSFSTIINLNDAKKILKKNIENNKLKFSTDYRAHSPAKISLDIRGCKFEDAQDKISTHIEAAVLSGLKRVIILHGKGTGVLQKATSELLKKHPNVQSFMFAPLEAGGYGITEVTLK